jgi:hypothetical protein
MRPAGMVMKRCIEGELKTMFGNGVYLGFGQGETSVVPELGQPSRNPDLEGSENGILDTSIEIPRKLLV